MNHELTTDEQDRIDRQVRLGVRIGQAGLVAVGLGLIAITLGRRIARAALAPCDCEDTVDGLASAVQAIDDSITGTVEAVGLLDEDALRERMRPAAGATVATTFGETPVANGPGKVVEPQVDAEAIGDEVGEAANDAAPAE